jgi:DeoR family transcriptional regulator of aga operon
MGEVRRVSRYQRWNELLDLMPGDGQLSVAEAARQLGVSQATIRRDLDQLAEQQLLTRTRGGAVAGNVSYDLPLRYKTARHAVEKQRVGRPHCPGRRGGAERRYHRQRGRAGPSHPA